MEHFMLNLPVTGMNGYENFDRSLCDLLIIFTECKGCDTYRKMTKYFLFCAKNHFLPEWEHLVSHTGTA